MKFNQILGIATIALSSLFISGGKASAIVYPFNDAIPLKSDPLSVSGFFDIDDSLGANPGIVEFGTELIDYSLEISSSTSGVPSTTLVPSNSVIDLFDLAGVIVNSSQLDFSGATSGSLCVSNTNCIDTLTPEKAVFGLDRSTFVLDLGAEPNDNFEDNSSALGSFDNFPQQINSSSVTIPEPSFTLGLVLIGGLFCVTRYRNR